MMKKTFEAIQGDNGSDRSWQRAASYSTALLFLLIASPIVAQDVAAATARPGEVQRVDSLVHDWFALLEGGTLESRDLGSFVAELSFELSLIDASIRSLGELEAWRSKLSLTHLQLEYRIASIDVQTVGDDLRLARFEFERRAVDDEGIPHIARREHAWLVRDVSGEAPVILRIDERPLLAFRGTGPQVICY